MRKKQNHLPEKFHELVKIAIEDVKACRVDPNYQLDMTTWHDGTVKSEPCRVCMAGAVIAKTLGMEKDDCFHPENWEQKTELSLLAIDSLRNGYLENALFRMGIPVPNEDLSSFPCPIPSINFKYDSAFNEFIKSWEKAQKWLEERDL